MTLHRFAFDSRLAAAVAVSLCLTSGLGAPGAFAQASSKAAAARFPVVEKRFEQFVSRYVQSGFAFDPPSATGAGMHAYDAKLPDYAPAALAAEEKRIRAALAEMGKIDRKQLSPAVQLDYDLYLRKIENDLYRLIEERRREIDPGYFNVGWAIEPLISQQFAPPEKRLQSIVGRLSETPRYLAQGREILKRPPRLFTEFAIEEFPGTITYLETTVPRAFESVKNPALWKKYKTALAGAKAATEKHVVWMKETLLPRSDGSFVLGEERYRKKLYYDEMVDMPLDALLAVGQKELDRLEARYKACAAKIAPGGTVADALAKVRPNHPPKDELLAVASRLLEEQRSFSISSGFLAMPSEERCTVRATPEFAAGRSFASLDAPGPPREDGAKGLLQHLASRRRLGRGADGGISAGLRSRTALIGLDPRGVSRPLRALPLRQGRHVARAADRGMRFLRRRVGPLREEGMIDQGYGAGDPELELGMLKWALVRACRFQVGIRVHTKGMSLEDATKYFQEHAGMEAVNAQREAFRAAFDPTYLIYTLGALQIRKLRDDMKVEQGTAFNLGQFHATILSQGSVPVVLLRRLMLKEEGSSL